MNNVLLVINYYCPTFNQCGKGYKRQNPIKAVSKAYSNCGIAFKSRLSLNGLVHFKNDTNRKSENVSDHKRSKRRKIHGHFQRDNLITPCRFQLASDSYTLYPQRYKFHFNVVQPDMTLLYYCMSDLFLSDQSI